MNINIIPRRDSIKSISNLILASKVIRVKGHKSPVI